MSIQNLFTERLKSARQKANLSQKQLGIKIGIDEFSASPRMNQYERGKHLPNLETSRRLGNELNIPMAYFYCPEPDLAELLLVLHKMSAEEKIRLLQQLNQTSQKKELYQA